MYSKKRMRKVFCFSLLALFLPVLVGCGAGRTMVLKAPVEKVTTREIGLVEEEPTVNVPREVRDTFHEKLERALFEAKDGKEPPFARGSDLKLRYRFVQFNPGSQFSRWFWGGIGNAGEGTMTVEATFLREGGEDLSKIQCEGKISSGFFGGSFDFALERAAKEIVTFAEGNFK